MTPRRGPDLAATPPTTVRDPVRLLRDVVEHGGVTIQEGDIGNLLGVTLFGERTIILSPGLTDEQWYSTVTHELVHLKRGPVPHSCAEQEEDRVRHEVAVMLVPSGSALAELDRRWEAAEMQELASRHAVDLDVVLDALNPPTQPIPRVTDHDDARIVYLPVPRVPVDLRHAARTRATTA